MLKKTKSTLVTMDPMYRKLEKDGIIYEKGDNIGISKERGQLTFQWWEETKSGGVAVCCMWRYHGLQMFRQYDISRVRKPKIKKAGARATKFLYCDDHPTYGAVRRPRTDCGSCWSAYNSTHDGEKVKKSKKPVLVSATNKDIDWSDN